jgi:hypothetical protein
MGLTFDIEEHPERFRFRRGDAVVRRDDSDASGIIVAGTREEEGSRYVEVYDIERPDGKRFRAEDVELDLARRIPLG